MKSSIRSKFTMGMIFLFLIILVLSVFSGISLTRLSSKTGAILKENYLSVEYAGDMSEGTVNICQEITRSFLLLLLLLTFLKTEVQKASLFLMSGSEGCSLFYFKIYLTLLHKSTSYR